MTTRPITVYAELTPNPNSLKFVADVMLLEGGTVEYFSKEDAVNCPLAAQLFDFSGVEKVFITSNFVTVTKQAELDWYDITNILREFIRGYLMSGEPLFIGSPFHPSHIPGKNGPSNSYQNEGDGRWTIADERCSIVAAAVLAIADRLSAIAFIS